MELNDRTTTQTSDQVARVEMSNSFTFELSTLQQCSRLLQGEELLDGDKVVVHP